MSPNRLLLLGAVPVGAVLGALCWMLFGGGGAAAERIQSYQTRLAAFPAMAPRRSSATAMAAEAITRPLFTLTTGPGAVADVSLTIQGIARTPRRSAALVSLNGGTAQWLEAGKALGGILLVEVRGAQAVFETPFGRRTVTLGAAAAATPAPTTARPGPNGAPQGTHMPPEPASAPGNP